MGTASNGNSKDLKYCIYTLIGLFFMFGFGMLPPIPPLTPVGMKVLGIFIAVLFLWSTVGLAWPALMGIVALGMSGYCTVNEAIALKLCGMAGIDVHASCGRRYVLRTWRIHCQMDHQPAFPERETHPVCIHVFHGILCFVHHDNFHRRYPAGMERDTEPG